MAFSEAAERRFSEMPSCDFLTIILNARHGLSNEPVRPRGGVVTQRTANPCTPVQFRARPPIFSPHDIVRLKCSSIGGIGLLGRELYQTRWPGEKSNCVGLIPVK